MKISSESLGIIINVTKILLRWRFEKDLGA